MSFRVTILLFFLLHPNLSSGGIQVGTENNFFIQGSMAAGIVSRNYLVAGGGGVYAGPVAYFNIPYLDFTENIFGLSLRFGESFLFGIDAGILNRKVFDLKGKGYAGALVMGYNISQRVHISVPILYRRINSGELQERQELSVVPQIGLHFGK